MKFLIFHFLHILLNAEKQEYNAFSKIQSFTNTPHIKGFFVVHLNKKYLSMVGKNHVANIVHFSQNLFLHHLSGHESRTLEHWDTKFN